MSFWRSANGDAAGSGIGAGAVFWLEQALADEQATPCPPLAGRREVDVCIVGGGYTGLWTAIELADRGPGWRICLIEAQGCGFGASGRNGGWVDELV